MTTTDSTYQSTLSYLYAQLPVFEHVGAHAYKPGLERCIAMAERLGHPERRFRTIHVAGTNGKGSTSHLLASVLQASGLRVGLFTSPHLLDYSERIRINGQPIDPQYVVDWTARWFPAEEQDAETTLRDTQPSFFELATMMAFSYFADKGVDIAVIEVGLGGRLDSTNIITPMVSVITNIALDHTQLLGDTLPQIAAEKAGIMKPGVPCVVGECTDERVRFTFQQNATLHQASRLIFADHEPEVMWAEATADHTQMRYLTRSGLELFCPLMGSCQPHNANTVLTALMQLREEGLSITDEAIAQGFSGILRLTHLRGRWETLLAYPDGRPYVLCDTGHNPACFAYLGPALRRIAQSQDAPLHIVMGMVADKDQASVMQLLPAEAIYHWCNPDSPRALKAEALAAMGAEAGLQGTIHASIDAALDSALKATGGTTEDARQAHGTVFVGGSNFVVCEVMKRF